MAPTSATTSSPMNSPRYRSPAPLGRACTRWVSWSTKISPSRLIENELPPSPLAQKGVSTIGLQCFSGAMSQRVHCQSRLFGAINYVIVLQRSLLETCITALLERCDPTQSLPRWRRFERKRESTSCFVALCYRNPGAVVAFSSPTLTACKDGQSVVA